MTEPLVRRAHGKINVFLRVLGRRPDGYHDVETLLLPVSLSDAVGVEAAEGLTLDLQGDPPALDLLGEEDPEANLALVAARTLAEAAGIDVATKGAILHVVKRVPVAGGMAGGSADAAAVLHELNRLWGCGLDDAALAAIGLRIGSDVPAMLAEAPVMVRGRGEIVEPIYATPTPWIVKSLDFPIAAADAYRWWDEDGARTGPDGGVVVAAIETGATGTLGASIFNDLEPGIVARHPEIAEIEETFLAAGAEAAFVSGSGPTVVALAPHVIHADKIAEQVPGSIVVMGPPG